MISPPFIRASAIRWLRERSLAGAPKSESQRRICGSMRDCLGKMTRKVPIASSNRGGTHICCAKHDGNTRSSMLDDSLSSAWHYGVLEQLHEDRVASTGDASSAEGVDGDRSVQPARVRDDEAIGEDLDLHGGAPRLGREVPMGERVDYCLAQCRDRNLGPSESGRSGRNAWMTQISANGAQSLRQHETNRPLDPYVVDQALVMRPRLADLFPGIGGDEHRELREECLRFASPYAPGSRSTRKPSAPGKRGASGHQPDGRIVPGNVGLEFFRGGEVGLSLGLRSPAQLREPTHIKRIARFLALLDGSGGVRDGAIELRPVCQRPQPSLAPEAVRSGRIRIRRCK